MPSEVEVKLGAPAGFRMPDLEGVVTGTAGPRPRSLDLRTTYFDTRDLRLACCGFATNAELPVLPLV